MNLLIRKYLPSKTNLIISLFIFFSVLKTGDCYAQWIMQYNSGLAVFDVRFLNRDTGWACGDNQILKTTNGGDNWILQSVPTTGYFRQVHPVNDSVVYICGWYVILKTTDGGNNWNIVRVGQDQAPQLDGLWFINEETGWFCGDRVVMRTTNGGNTFIDSTRLSNSTYDIHFKNDSTGVIAGYSKMFRTTNSGTNWYSVALPYTSIIPFCDRVSFKGDTGWTASWANIVYKTTNYGVNWDSITRIINENGHSTRCIEFSSNLTGYAGGRNGKIFKTTNGGYSWTQQQQNLGLASLISIYSTNDSLVWVVGGAIYYTENGGLTIVKKTDFLINNEFMLYQNYPNPFNSETNIEYSLLRSGFVTINIYDLLGKEIESLINEKQSKGIHRLGFTGENISSGIYIYELRINGITIKTKRMIMLK